MTKNKMKYSIKITLFLLITFMIYLTSCLDFVEDGIDITYGDSNASFTVESIGTANGAENETISFSIQVNSDFDIKSCIITTSTEGKNGSGFNVGDSNFDDPFADHNYGTIRPGIKSFKVRYDYIIPEKTNKSIIKFTIVDESGKTDLEKEIQVVPSIIRHNNLVLYAKNTTFHDALASSDGIVFPDIKTNYASLSEENVAVQRKIDIVFYYNPNNKVSSLVSIASSRLDLDISIENNTSFIKLDFPNSLDLADITPARLAEITKMNDYLLDGDSEIDRIKVGDIIGFRADVNAINSLKAGILKVEGLHPGSVPRYAGISYVLECSLVIQK
jgi:hypothetical protein